MKKISIVIVGGGTAGWMAAAAFSKLLPKAWFDLTLIESEKIGTVGVGEATIPSIRYFNRLLDIDESEFMKCTSATFKLGIQFENWGALGDNYIHPFGDYRYSLNGMPVGIHHFWMHAKKGGYTEVFESLSLPVQMCRQNKFELPQTDRRDLRSTFNYAYHIDASAYARFLRTYAETNGVVRKEGVIQQVLTEQDAITGLVVEGTTIAADLYIDASGFGSLLMGKALNIEFEDWSRYLICDSAVAIPAENQHSSPYTRAVARSAGWQWCIPLQHRSGNGLVYSSDFMTKTSAEEFLTKNLPGAPLRDPIHLKFKAGKRIKAWHNNCVAIGLSGGFLEPLESTSIYLIQESILKLIDFLKNQNLCQIAINTYNKLIDLEYDRIRDFIILHYVLTKRDDSEFWRYCKNMDIPDSLAYKLDLFEECGLIENYNHGLFQIPSWLSVFIGQGLQPRYSDIRVNGANPEYIAEQLVLLASNVSGLAREMETHKHFIERYL